MVSLRRTISRVYMQGQLRLVNSFIYHLLSGLAEQPIQFQSVLAQHFKLGFDETGVGVVAILFKSELELLTLDTVILNVALLDQASCCECYLILGTVGTRFSFSEQPARWALETIH